MLLAYSSPLVNGPDLNKYLSAILQFFHLSLKFHTKYPQGFPRLISLHSKIKTKKNFALINRKLNKIKTFPKNKIFKWKLLNWTDGKLDYNNNFRADYRENFWVESSETNFHETFQFRNFCVKTQFSHKIENFLCAKMDTIIINFYDFLNSFVLKLMIF